MSGTPFMTNADQVLPAGPEGSLFEVSSDHQPAARVLAVDDESSACKLLSLILAPPVFNCTTACNGEEALVALQRERFDAVISTSTCPASAVWSCSLKFAAAILIWRFWSPPALMTWTWACRRCVAVRTTISLNP